MNYLPALAKLSQSNKELVLDAEIPRIPKPTALEFCRDYVSQNRPVIMTGAISHWPAIRKWTNAYLRKTVGECEVTIDVTPTGRGDAVVEDKYFVMPEERRMKFSEFLDKLQNPTDSGVFYCSHQNSSFTTEFSALMKDIDYSSITSWAEPAIGTSLDAVNFWMGEPRSVSSLHKDHYENLYAVIAGEKNFILLPPTDYWTLYERPFTVARYFQEPSSQWKIIPADPPEQRPWIPVDPSEPDPEKYPLYRYASPRRVVVRAGEVLYLPSLHYHQVAQSGDSEGRTIAVNFWFDMHYGMLYNYYSFVQDITKLAMRESNTNYGL